MVPPLDLPFVLLVEDEDAAVILKRNYCRKCAEAFKESRPQPPVSQTSREEQRPTVRVPVAKPSTFTPKLLIAIVFAIVLLALIVVVATKR